ncbi:RNA polymerase sigma factor [Puia sp. P3]|uniref:RNA polymerase sigma factor n=1 Tax=Puia sp. P3 TaxID=3423952 RepID=UPI003D67EA0F
MDQETIYIQQVLAGDTNRFGYFVEKYQKMAFATAMGILGNEADAEEAVQDAFLKAFRGLSSFRGVSKFSTWLCRITINCALSRVGSRGGGGGGGSRGSRGGGGGGTLGSRDSGGGSRSSLFSLFRGSRATFVELELAEEQLADVDSSYRGLNDQDQARCIREALDRMDVEDRLVLTLYYLNEQSIEEISAATVWSRDVIKMRLHRARKRMYAILSKMPELKNS